MKFTVEEIEELRIRLFTFVLSDCIKPLDLRYKELREFINSIIENQHNRMSIRQHLSDLTPESQIFIKELLQHLEKIDEVDELDELDDNLDSWTIEQIKIQFWYIKDSIKRCLLLLEEFEDGNAIRCLLRKTDESKQFLLALYEAHYAVFYGKRDLLIYKKYPKLLSDISFTDFRIEFTEDTIQNNFPNIDRLRQIDTKMRILRIQQERYAIFMNFYLLFEYKAPYAIKKHIVPLYQRFAQRYEYAFSILPEKLTNELNNIDALYQQQHKEVDCNEKLLKEEINRVVDEWANTTQLALSDVVSVTSEEAELLASDEIFSCEENLISAVKERFALSRDADEEQKQIIVIKHLYHSLKCNEKYSDKFRKELKEIPIRLESNIQKLEFNILEELAQYWQLNYQIFYQFAAFFDGIDRYIKSEPHGMCEYQNWSTNPNLIMRDTICTLGHFFLYPEANITETKQYLSSEFIKLLHKYIDETGCEIYISFLKQKLGQQHEFGLKTFEEFYMPLLTDIKLFKHCRDEFANEACFHNKQYPSDYLNRMSIYCDKTKFINGFRELFIREILIDKPNELPQQNNFNSKLILAISILFCMLGLILAVYLSLWVGISIIAISLILFVFGIYKIVSKPKTTLAINKPHEQAFSILSNCSQEQKNFNIIRKMPNSDDNIQHSNKTLMK